MRSIVKAPIFILILAICAIQYSNGFLTFKKQLKLLPLSSIDCQPQLSNQRRRSNIFKVFSSASISPSLDDNKANNDDDNDENYIKPPSSSSKGLGEYDSLQDLRREDVNVGDPQIKVKEKERSVTSILRELAAIQQQGPQKYCILGTRHCSFLHQQIIELLAYALVLSGNHVYTSGAGGTHAATIRGALRAEQDDLLTVVLPQSMEKQTKESRELLKNVTDVISMPQNDNMSLDVASRICNSYLLSQTDQLISFAFHESSTVIEATKEAKELDMLVTVLYLD